MFLFPRWIDAITRAFPRYRPCYLIARDEGDISGMIPLVRTSWLGIEQYLSLPFGGHGGPILTPDAGPETPAALALAFRDLGTRLRTMRFEMSVMNPSPSLREAMAPALGSFYREFRTHLVDLSGGFEDLWGNRYRRGTRKCVRTAERAEVTVAIEGGQEVLDILFRSHKEQSRIWKGIHAYPKEAMQVMVEAFDEEARVYVARRDGRPLAACLFLYHRGREVHPWVSGAVPEARPHRAFHLLLNAAIRDACRDGYKVWNFGGSGGNRSIEFFKESFGAEPFPVLRCFHLASWARRLRKRPAWDD